MFKGYSFFYGLGKMEGKIKLDPTTYKQLADAIAKVYVEKIPEIISKNIIEIKVTDLYLGYTAEVNATIPVEG